MTCVSSGSKGDILPVTKDGIPIAVYAASNIAIAGKRNFSLYTKNIDEIDNLLMFYVVDYIRGNDILDINSLSSRYRFFYQFTDRSAITKEHLDMLPEGRRPSKLEAFIICFLSALLVVGAAVSVGIKALYKNVKPFRDVVDGAGDILNGVGKALSNSLSSLKGAFGW